MRWPVKVLPPRRVSFDIAPRSLAAPANVYGIGQVISQDAGIWRATFGDIHVRGRDPVVAFRGIATELEGRINTILVPLCRSYQPHAPGSVEAGIFDIVPHNDGAYFEDDTGYVSSSIYAYNAFTAEARATALTIGVVYGGTLEPGHHFSVGGRLYRIKTVSYSSPGIANVTIRPPVREAIPSGTHLEFDDPVCRMRLATDTEMDLSLDMRRQGNPTVNFVEYL